MEMGTDVCAAASGLMYLETVGHLCSIGIERGEERGKRKGRERREEGPGKEREKYRTASLWVLMAAEECPGKGQPALPPDPCDLRVNLFRLPQSSSCYLRSVAHPMNSSFL